MVEVAFTSDFTYSSISLADFQLDGFELTVFDDPSNSVTFNTEALGDFSNFAEDLSLVSEITHTMQFKADYSGAGATIINPSVAMRYPNSEYVVAYWQQTGSNTLGYYKNQQGEVRDVENAATNSLITNVTTTWAVGREQQPFFSQNYLGLAMEAIDVSSEASFATYKNLSNITSEIYDQVITGSSGDVICLYVSQPEGNSQTISSRGDFVYVSGNGTDTLSINAVWARMPASNNPAPIAVDSLLTLTTSGSKSVAACLYEKNKFVVFYNGQVRDYTYTFSFTLSQNQRPTPSMILTNTYTLSDYYVNRLWYDTGNSHFYFLGLPSTGSVVPATFTSLNVYKANTDFTTVSQVGTVAAAKGFNRGVQSLNNSQLYLFEGLSVDICFDAASDSVIATSSRVSNNLSLLDNGFLLSGINRQWLGDPWTIALIRTTKAGNYSDWLDNEYKIVTIFED